VRLLGLGGLAAPSLQGGPDEQRAQELQLAQHHRPPEEFAPPAAGVVRRAKRPHLTDLQWVVDSYVLALAALTR
jgi:hypothetical protein